MKVYELIAELSKCSADAEVLTLCCDDNPIYHGRLCDKGRL